MLKKFGKPGKYFEKTSGSPELNSRLPRVQGNSRNFNILKISRNFFAIFRMRYNLVQYFFKEINFV